MHIPRGDSFVTKHHLANKKTKTNKNQRVQTRKTRDITTAQSFIPESSQRQTLRTDH